MARCSPAAHPGRRCGRGEPRRGRGEDRSPRPAHTPSFRPTTASGPSRRRGTARGRHRLQLENSARRPGDDRPPPARPGLRAGALLSRKRACGPVRPQAPLSYEGEPRRAGAIMRALHGSWMQSVNEEDHIDLIQPAVAVQIADGQVTQAADSRPPRSRRKRPSTA